MATTNKHSTAIAEIVSALIKAYEDGSTLNFTSLKNSVAKKRKLKGIPKVVDVLSAIPERYREALTPFLKTKPVRGASGVAVVAVMSKVRQ